MAVSAVAGPQQTLALDNPTTLDDQQLAEEFAASIVQAAGPLMASAIMRQMGFAKQILDEALRDD